MKTKVSTLLLCLLASAPAAAKIPDFSVANAPESVKSSTNPAAREFWRDLVTLSKREGGRMFDDTQKTTGLKRADMKKTDWDCLFWRVAATFAKKFRRQHPNLQNPAFADQLEKTSLDDDDCPDEGGPGSLGVRVYNTAINQVMAGRGGWQKTGPTETPVTPAPRDELPPYAKVSSSLLRAFMAAGVVIGDAAEGAATLAGGLMPILVLPQGMVDTLVNGKKQADEL